MTPAPQPPNCSTCNLPTKLYFEDTIHSKDAYVYDCPITGHWMPSLEDGGTIFKTGCLFHPDARAYLMRDVIEELESHCVPGDSVWVHYSPNDIISLIRDGVKPMTPAPQPPTDTLWICTNCGFKNNTNPLRCPACGWDEFTSVIIWK